MGQMNEKKLLHFTKMHGCGNDYIYINCLISEPENPEDLAIRLSDRHFGIGGDGLVLICKSDTADAKMRMFNLDGSEGKMCGNAIRCVAKYLYDNGIVKKTTLQIETLSGIKILELFVQDGMVSTVQVDMGPPELSPKKIPVNLPLDRVVNEQIRVGDEDVKVTCVSMGNPHCVVFCSEVDSLPLCEIGPKFENHPLFPERINTEFIRVIDESTLLMRVWERGSGETLACGTGACAAVVAAILNGYCEKGTNIKVLLLGGELIIRYTGETVLMTGAAQTVFEGVVEV